MPPPLHVRDEAAADIDAAFSWYEARSAGVGTQFLTEVRRVLKGIEATPLRHPVIRDPVRRALLRTFPYGLFYTSRFRVHRRDRMFAFPAIAPSLVSPRPLTPASRLAAA